MQVVFHNRRRGLVLVDAAHETQSLRMPALYIHLSEPELVIDASRRIAHQQQ